MDDLLETATRCPHCQASVRPGAPWCTLCHADLRPAPPPPPVFAPPPPPPAYDPLTAPPSTLGLPNRVEPTWPCSTCGVTNPLAVEACVSCGAGFLSALRDAEGPLLELPGVGDITRLSRGQRMLIALGVVVAILSLVAVLGLLFS